MPDHTEREREARVALDSAYESAAVESHYDEDRYCDARNAYRAAVRAAVLAEVREKVEECPRVRYTDPLGFYLRTVLDVADIRAALTALEATDGR